MGLDQLQRRELLALLGATLTCPLAAHAQLLGRVRRIGVLLLALADDPESQVRSARFLQGLQEVGWTVGRNVQIDWRWSTVDRDRYRALAAKLVALGPDVLLASGASVQPLREATHTIPIVFAGINDPVGGGLSQAWRIRAATSPALPDLNMGSAQNGCSCSSRLLPM
jgi:putative ABC transport system substrate-binding protein